MNGRRAPRRRHPGKTLAAEVSGRLPSPIAGQVQAAPPENLPPTGRQEGAGWRRLGEVAAAMCAEWRLRHVEGRPDG